MVNCCFVCFFFFEKKKDNVQEVQMSVCLHTDTKCHRLTCALTQSNQSDFWTRHHELSGAPSTSQPLSLQKPLQYLNVTQFYLQAFKMCDIYFMGTECIKAGRGGGFIAPPFKSASTLSSTYQPSKPPCHLPPCIAFCSVSVQVNASLGIRHVDQSRCFCFCQWLLQIEASLRLKLQTAILCEFWALAMKHMNKFRGFINHQQLSFTWWRLILSIQSLFICTEVKSQDFSKCVGPPEWQRSLNEFQLRAKLSQ